MWCGNQNYTQVRKCRVASLIKVKAANGRTYVYENVSYWDRDEKKTKHKRTCIGHIDPESGEIVPNRRKGKAGDDPERCTKPETCRVVGCGVALVLDHYARETGLESVLKKVFPKEWQEILTCAYYLLSVGGALSHVETWSADNATPLGRILTSQRVSELLQTLDYGRQLSFFQTWNKREGADAYYAMDITSVSSYSEQNEYVQNGYNRDHEPLPQINLLLITGMESGLPLYYRALPGSLGDVRTVRETVRAFELLQLRKVHFVMDRGFWSRTNIDDFYSTHSKFLIGVPFTARLARDAVEKCRETILAFQNYRRIGHGDYYLMTELQKWGSHRFYVHTYFNSDKADEERRSFDWRLAQCRQELEAGQTIRSHEHDYEAFFIVKETPKRGRKVMINEEAVKAHRHSRAGWFVLGTNDIKDPVTALEVYHSRDRVEKAFENLKNSKDMKRLRVHSAKAMEGRLFLQFIALILDSSIRQKLQQISWLESHSLRDAFRELTTLRRVEIPGRRESLYTTPTRLQRQLTEWLGVEIPTCV